MYTFRFLIKGEVNMQNKKVIACFESFLDKWSFYKQCIEILDFQVKLNVLSKCIDRLKIQN